MIGQQIRYGRIEDRMAYEFSISVLGSIVSDGLVVGLEDVVEAVGRYYVLEVIRYGSTVG